MIRPAHVLAALVACGDTVNPPAPSMIARPPDFADEMLPPPAVPVPPALLSARVLDVVFSAR